MIVIVEGYAEARNNEKESSAALIISTKLKIKFTCSCSDCGLPLEGSVGLNSPPASRLVLQQISQPPPDRLPTVATTSRTPNNKSLLWPPVVSRRFSISHSHHHRTFIRLSPLPSPSILACETCLLPPIPTLDKTTFPHLSLDLDRHPSRLLPDLQNGSGFPSIPLPLMPSRVR
jgi:hypothetical protein